MTEQIRRNHITCGFCYFILILVVSCPLLAQEGKADKSDAVIQEFVLQGRIWKQTFTNFDGAEKQADLVVSIPAGPSNSAKELGERRWVDFIIDNASTLKDDEPLASHWEKLARDDAQRGISCFVKGRIKSFVDGYYHVEVEKLEIPDRIGVESEILNRPIAARDLESNIAYLNYDGEVVKDGNCYFTTDHAFELSFQSKQGPEENRHRMRFYAALVPPDPATDPTEPLVARIVEINYRDNH